jgi:Electron transfer DM13
VISIKYWRAISMNKRSKVAVIVTIVAIIVGVGAFYLVSPLFVSTQVNDPLPTGAEQSESYQRFISMNEDEKMQAARQMNAEARDGIMSSAAQVNNSLNEPMNQTLVREDQQRIPNATTTPNALRTGSFVGVGDGIHNAEGIAKVIPLQDGSSILRLENLHVTNGPDLYVYLSPDKSASDFVNIGKLKANNGNQNYGIPAETDLSKYDTVLIWCRPFSVLFGSADLMGYT